MRIPLSIACTLTFTAFAGAAEPAPAKVDFNREVRPIIASQCLQCHGPDEKTRKAKLRLDIRDDAIKGGVIVPGKPDESELIKRICSTEPELKMPPAKLKKPPLNPAELAVLKRWIAEGANYSEHWAFTKLTRPEVPKVENPPFPIRNAIDSFILYRLKQEGVKPAAEADRVTLIRRLYFDLTGLPPTPEEVRAFVEDKSPDAYEKLVEKLLTSPHHGERLAVWWLDLVRYADSCGYHSDNPINVSPFRDYVIKSFTANKPFDVFTTEQLAGDLLPNPTLEQRVGSAYNRLLQTTEEGGAQPKEYIAKYAADRVRNYGQVWLGGTIMCAECHNHKFDPYTQSDFYSIAAFFADIQEAAVGRREQGLAVPTAAQEEKLKSLAEAITTAQNKLTAAAKEFAEKPDAFADVEKWTSPPVGKKASGVVVVPADLKPILAKKPADRTAAEVAKLMPFAQANAPALKKERDAIATATKAKTDFEGTVPHVLVSVSGGPRTVRILPRGNWLDDSGPVMLPNTPGFLPGLPAKADPKARYTRLDLAKWTVSPENPLTSRVAVNRLWRLFFGYGIARSLEESGTQGQPPTHPELLDWLAAEFQTKWDVRHMVRLMVLSSAYRQSSVETPAIRERDISNKLFARQSRARLDAEFIRDSALSISGLLNRDIGGPSVKPYQPAGYWSALNFPTREWQKDAAPHVYRRGMYTHWQRSFPHPAMVAFDAPSREECACDRPRSNIPQQALVLLNDPEFVEAARVFGQKALAEGGKDDTARIAWAFERATGRKPNDKEATLLAALLAKHRTDFAAKPAEAKALLAIGDTPAPKDAKPEEVAAWTNVCRVILNLHETITRQ